MFGYDQGVMSSLLTVSVVVGGGLSISILHDVPCLMRGCIFSFLVSNDNSQLPHLSQQQTKYAMKKDNAPVRLSFNQWVNDPSISYVFIRDSYASTIEHGQHLSDCKFLWWIYYAVYMHMRLTFIPHDRVAFWVLCWSYFTVTLGVDAVRHFGARGSSL